MEFKKIKLGDGEFEARGWLVISRGAVRGVLIPYSGQYVLHFSCDSAIQVMYNHALFRDWEMAADWLKNQLEPDDETPPDVSERQAG